MIPGGFVVTAPVPVPAVVTVRVLFVLHGASDSVDGDEHVRHTAVQVISLFTITGFGEQQGIPGMLGEHPGPS